MKPQWQNLPYGMNGQFWDVNGVGRYVVRPERKGVRTWRAYLNSKSTSFTAIGGEKVKLMVERAVRSQQL